MIFVIFVIIGTVGIVGTIWISSGSLRYAENPVRTGDEWFSLTPEKIETQISNVAHAKFREVIKVILRWAIKNYRQTTRDLQIKQEIKKRVRAFLYDHRNDTPRNPSAMWGQLRNTPKHNPNPVNDPHVISPDEITSSSQ